MHPVIEKIRNSPCGKLNKHLFAEEGKPKNPGPKTSPNVQWMEQELLKFCQERNYTLKTEFLFHPYRKWRFDFGIFKGVTIKQIERFEYEKENIVAALEYNGIRSKKSRHTTHTGYTGDMDKINAALSLGWKVFQFTPLNVKDFIEVLEKAI